MFWAIQGMSSALVERDRENGLARASWKLHPTLSQLETK